MERFRVRCLSTKVHTRRHAVAALVIVLLLGALPASAELQVTASAGFERRVVENRGCPLTLSLLSDAPFTGSVLITAPGRFARRLPVELTAGRKVELALTIEWPAGRPLRIEFFDAEGRPVKDRNDRNLVLREDEVVDQRIDLQSFHLVEVSSSAILLNGLPQWQNPPRGTSGPLQRARPVMSHCAPAALPDNPLALQAAQVIMLGDLAYDEMPPATRAALLAWVADGGTLIVRGGDNAEELNASWLAPYLPQRDLTVLLTDSALPGAPAAAPYPLLDLAAGGMTPRGTPLVMSEDAVFGNGCIRLLAFDPALEPFRSSPDCAGLVLDRLPLEQHTLTQRWVQGYQEQQTLLQRISSAADIKPPPLFLLGIILFLYLIIVAPLNFFILGRVQRRELAWLTIPVIVAAFSILMYGVGRFSMGGSTIYREVRLTRADCTHRTAVTHAVAGIFSSSSDDFLLRLPAGTLHAAFPAENPHGYDNREEVLTVSGVPPEEGGPFPINQWSWQHFVVQSQATPDWQVSFDPATRLVTVEGDLDLNGAVLRQGGRLYGLQGAGSGRWRLTQDGNSASFAEFSGLLGMRQGDVRARIYQRTDGAEPSVGDNHARDRSATELLVIIPEVSGGDDAAAD